MKLFIIGISGSVGSLLADRSSARGDSVRGLVRRSDPRATGESRGIRTVVGDLSTMAVDKLASAFGDADVIVFAAGSNGGTRDTSKAIDGDGVDTAIEAARLAGIERFVLVSVFPESWRERQLGDEVEYYFTVKKAADVALSRSGLDWVILRPSLLVDEPGAGTVSLGPAELHGQIAREDVADVLAELLHTPRVSRQILELNNGPMPIPEAVRANLR